MNAATAAARRPRPFHKFKNCENGVDEDVYYNGRKLSSGESPGNLSVPQENASHVPAMRQLLPATAIAASPEARMTLQSLPRCSAADGFVPMQVHSSMLGGTPLFVQTINPEQPPTDQQLSVLNQYPVQTYAQGTVVEHNALQAQNRRQQEESNHRNPQGQPQLSPSATDATQTGEVDIPSSKPSSTVFTPRFTAEVPVPPLFTPNAAGRHLSTILGLTTPTAMATPGSKVPFAAQSTTTERTGANIPQSISRAVEPQRMVNKDDRGSELGLRTRKHMNSDSESQIREAQFADPQLINGQEDENVDSKPINSPMSYTRNSELAKSTSEAVPKNASNEAKSDPCVVPGSSNSNEKTTVRGGTRKKPDLRVAIPNSNRDDLTAVTSSGLFSATIPTNGSDFLPGLGPTLGSSRLPSMSPTGYGIWSSGWHPLGSGDRDAFPVPLTPFLNENLDSFRDGHDSEFGAGHPFSLPSPTNAGLIPLTPRFLGFDPLISARGDPSSAIPPKRTFEQAFENGVSNPKQK